MTEENWHENFNPRNFLGKVDLDSLIEKNTVFQESHRDLFKDESCLYCGTYAKRGIQLNNGEFLCSSCFEDVTKISYPEKYEKRRRDYLTRKEARKQAWEKFRDTYEVKEESSTLTALGFISLLLLIFDFKFIGVPILFFVWGSMNNARNSSKYEKWIHRKEHWEAENPIPEEPELFHFHDPRASLTQNDKKVLKIFNHWPGYPPFWNYLRMVVLERDHHRCQVTGCPSRLELHIHHKTPVSTGGTHSPDNLVSLCAFHHALEPEKGHERIWGSVKTKFFTLVSAHQRSNRTGGGTHNVKAHLRRLELVHLEEIRAIAEFHGFRCPNCRGAKLKFELKSNSRKVEVSCGACKQATTGPRELTEETGPKLADLLQVTKIKGSWKARWDMLKERKSGQWGAWTKEDLTKRRKAHKRNTKIKESAPTCPKCGAPMRLIEPRVGDQWKSFWGCSNYKATGCKGSRRYKNMAK